MGRADGSSNVTTATTRMPSGAWTAIARLSAGLSVPGSMKDRRNINAPAERVAKLRSEMAISTLSGSTTNCVTTPVMITAWISVEKTISRCHNT